MPEQHIITGAVTSPENIDGAGIRIQVFDRDLPSLELRMGSAPPMLGEAVADAEGGFQITYTLEQFLSGEAALQFRRLHDKKADLSFRVFDAYGRELRIRSIEA